MTFSFSTVLGLIFVVLKVTHVIAWSWLWVLAPFWLGYAIGLAILLLGGLITAVVVARVFSRR